ncbi:hypothetical protein FXO37_05230 [Capsicum annuum]|nr:hypothetical protein FXO37_05230 [Capsicum annuum]
MEQLLHLNLLNIVFECYIPQEDLEWLQALPGAPVLGVMKIDVELRKMLDLLLLNSQCHFPHCPYPNCRKVKGLLRHGIQCKIRLSRGCVLCKKMWYLLQLQARAYKDSSDCHVPRCRDLKQHLRWLQQQSDSQRRAAIMERMRQQAEEVASSSW